MTVVVMLPTSSATTPSGWGIAGGASLNAVVSDSSDSSYAVDDVDVTSQNANRYLTSQYADFVLPANAIVVSATPYVRASQTAGFTHKLDVRAATGDKLGPQSLVTPTSAIKTFKLAALAASAFASSQLGGVAGLFTKIGTNGVRAALTHRIYKVWVELEYNEAPAASAVALSPADAYARTSAPAVVWTYTDPENDEQAGYEVAIWKSSDTTNPRWVGPGEAFADTSGVIHSPAALVAGESSAQACQVPASAALQNGVAYKVYVRVADAPLGTIRYGAWSAAYSFTQNVLTPPTPVTGEAFFEEARWLGGGSSFWDAAHWRTVIPFASRLNLLTENQASVETSPLSGWTGVAGTVARSTVQARSGVASLLLTSTTTGAASALSTKQRAEPGQVYTAIARARAVGIGQNITVGLYFYDQAGAQVGSAFGTAVADSTSAWSAMLSVTGTAPAQTYDVQVSLTGATTASGQGHYFDELGLYAAAAPPSAWSRGGLSGNAVALLERSADNGTTWVPCPIVATIPRTGARIDLYDTATPPNTPVRYRIFTRSVDEQGYSLTSPPSTTSGPITPVFGVLVLRDPLDGDGEIPVAVMGTLVVSQPERQGKFWAVGSPLTIVISDEIGSKTLPVRLLCRSREDRDRLAALRARKTTLLFQHDTTEAWWVRLGEPSTTEHIRNHSRRNPVDGSQAGFFVDFEMTEVAAPAGLPQNLT